VSLKVAYIFDNLCALTLKTLYFPKHRIYLCLYTPLFFKNQKVFQVIPRKITGNTGVLRVIILNFDIVAVEKQVVVSPSSAWQRVFNSQERSFALLRMTFYTTN